MKFGLREVLFVALLMCIPLGAWWFVFRPRSAQIGELREQMQAKRAKLSALNRAQANIEDLQGEIGQYNEAIALFQQAKSEPRRRGLCLLALGQCFQRIKQNRLAMTHYEQAISEIPERDETNHRQALYLAGKMAADLKDLGDFPRDSKPRFSPVAR